MRAELKKQEEALAKAQAKADTYRIASHSPDTILAVVKAINRLTQATLLVVRATDQAAQERWNRDRDIDERRAR